MSKTVSELVSDIQIRAGLPANQDRFLAPDIIKLLKQELQDSVLPFMYSLVQEFFVVGKLEPMQSPQISNITPDVSSQMIQAFTVTINGTSFTYTSDATPTALEVVAGLLALINAGVSGVTARGTTVLTLTANVINTSFILSTTANLSTVTVQGFNRFPNLLVPLPKRAYARGMRDLQFINSGSVRTNIPQIAPEDIDIFSMTSLANFTTPAGYFFRNDNIELVGTDVAITGNLDFTFYLKVPTLTSDTTLQAPVTNIQWNATTLLADLTVDVATFASASSFLSGTGLFDLYRYSSGAYTRVDLNCSITGSGSTRTFSTANLSQDLVTTLTSGQDGSFPVSAPYTYEYLIVPQDTIPYSPIPAELDNLLISSVCGRILESLGDTEGLSTNMAVLKKIQHNLAEIYGDRSVGETMKAVNRRGIYNFMRRRFLKGRI